MAAALGDTGDVAFIAGDKRLDVDGKAAVPRDTIEVRLASESDMRRRGTRLLSLLDDAVRRFRVNPRDGRLPAAVRAFPSVAFRYAPVVEVFDGWPDADAKLRRWFGLRGGRGRPARAIADAQTLMGTIMHECRTRGVEAALEHLERARLGGIRVLANRKVTEGELHELSTGGIWVKAENLLAVPWVAPKANALRWDSYVFQDPTGAAKQGERNENRS